VRRAAKSHFRLAWEILKRHWRVFILAQLAIVAAWAALEMAIVGAHWSGLPAIAYWPLWLCLHVVFFWVFSGLMAGIHGMALKAVDGGNPTFATALGGFDRGKTYLFTSLFYWTAVIGGLALVVIPGIVAAITWAPFRFVLSERPQTVRSSLRSAALLSASHRWELLRSQAACLMMNLAGISLLGVGLLVTFPLTVLLRASQFRALQHRPDSVWPAVVPPEKPEDQA
jgi:uncharacterized membrane protein